MKKKKSFVSSVIICVCVLVALCICALVYFFDIRSPVKTATAFHLGKGQSVSYVATELKKQNLIVSEKLFKISVRAQGSGVQSGEYEIPKRASVWHIARIFVNGEITGVSVLIPEGLTLRQVKNLLLEIPELTGKVECEKGNDSPVCKLQEGEIFPDTYRVAHGTSRLAVLDLARKKMGSIKNSWEKSGQILPPPLKTWKDVITLASIVQKEAAKESEMPIVASVYFNRLNKKMRLQADPTIVYALTNKLGDMKGAPLLEGHLKINSPYNTYINYGLPPTPIANVGNAAINAVLKPADTNYLYFVADGTGGHKFTNSYEEHQKNRTAWQEIKKSKNGNSEKTKDTPQTKSVGN